MSAWRPWPPPLFQIYLAISVRKHVLFFSLILSFSLSLASDVGAGCCSFLGVVFVDAFVVAIVVVMVAVLVVATAPPVTTPDEEPMAATPVAPPLHVPPTERSVSVVVVPAQIANVPSIGVGDGFTVTSAVMVHPAAEV